MDISPQVAQCVQQLTECTDRLNALALITDDLDVLNAIGAVDRQVREASALLLSEASAAAVMSGASLRVVAGATGQAPNTVRSSMARSSTMGGYATGGVVDASGVAIARHEAKAPMTFARRRPTTSATPTEGDQQ